MPSERNVCRSLADGCMRRRLRAGLNKGPNQFPPARASPRSRAITAGCQSIWRVDVTE